MTALPPYIARPEVQRRLLMIFPEGFPYRSYCTREIAGATVFAMLYIGAIDGTGVHLGPKHVYRMSDEQAARGTEDARRAYAEDALKPRFVGRGKAWYADTTREPIRDETLRQGLLSAGAAVDRRDLPVTSPQPRYALTPEFAALFNPAWQGTRLDQEIAAWQRRWLSPGSLARIELLRAGATVSESGLPVRFPNGETRWLSPGPSSVISKAVVEEFLPRFLQMGAVLWLSESGNKVVARDDGLARRIGLHVDPSRSLPDIILVDVGRPEVLVIFVEVVATDGPISEDRRKDLLAVAEQGRLQENCAFVTAFLDRTRPAFRKSVSTLAWNTFAWLASEPDHLIALLRVADPAHTKLQELLAPTRSNT